MASTFEGPFLVQDDRVLGAHRSGNVVGRTHGELAELLRLCDGHLRLLTVAAEAEGASDVIAMAKANGVTASVGHSYFGDADLRAAFDAGARVLTHLGNALPALIDKRDNPFYAGLLADDFTACFISDGRHLSTAMLRLLFRCKPLSKLVAVSDAAPIAGLPPGRYQALDQDVLVEPGGRAVNVEENHLVGSTATLLDCLNTLLRLGLCGPDGCAQVGGQNPLALLAMSPEALAPDAVRVTYVADSHSLRLVS